MTDNEKKRRPTPFPYPLFRHVDSWLRGSTGVQRYGCIRRSGDNNLREIPQRLGAPKFLVLTSSSGEGTLWGSSLLVTLALWDTLVLLRPHFPSPNLDLEEEGRIRKKRPKTSQNNFKPLSCSLKMSHRRLSKHFPTPKICTLKLQLSGTKTLRFVKALAFAISLRLRLEDVAI